MFCILRFSLLMCLGDCSISVPIEPLHFFHWLNCIPLYENAIIYLTVVFNMYLFIYLIVSGLSCSRQDLHSIIWPTGSLVVTLW